MLLLSLSSGAYATGNHYGWCLGVGNWQHNAACTGTGAVPLTVDTGAPLVTTPVGPQGVPTPGVVDVPAYPMPQPMTVPQRVPPKVPQPMAVPQPQQVPQPMAVPQLATPKVPQPQQVIEPQMVPQPMAVPQLATPKVPQPQQVIEPQLVAQPTAPQATPGAVPIKVPRPTPLAQPIMVPGPSQTVPQRQATSVPPIDRPAIVVPLPGRQPSHALPSQARSSGRDRITCLASGFGWRRVKTEDGEEKRVGLAPILYTPDMLLHDLPANHPRHAECIVIVDRRFED